MRSTNRRLLLVGVAAVGALALRCFAGIDPSASAGSSEKPKIAVIPKGTTHVYWKSVEAGAKAAGEAAGAEIVWKGPIKENDRQQQIDLVRSFVTEGVSGIVLAPLDRRALAGPVAEAKKKNIPVVIIDSALEGEAGIDYTAYIATDNEAAGKRGGARLAGLLGTSGKAVVLRYLVGSGSTEAREAGCLAALKDAGVTVLSDNRHAGATSGEATTAVTNMIDTVKQAGGIFCPNESSTLGALQALRRAGLAGKVKLVGFDSSPKLVEALRAGEIDALVVQDPVRMGTLGVETVLKSLKGESFERTVDTGAVLVTKDNVDSPDVQALIK